MAKPETSFRLGVEKYLPPQAELHREKMNNPYSAGTADSWYSAEKGDLWVEYKYDPLPKRLDTLIRCDLSELQKIWLARRHAEGRNVAVILGSPKGGIILRDLEWLSALTLQQYLGRVISRKELAAWIYDQTKGAP